LQGDLRESSQHIELSCKHHLSTTEHLLFRAASLALVSSDNTLKCADSSSTGHLKLTNSRSSSNLPPDIEFSKESLIRNCKSLNTSPTSSLTASELQAQIQDGERHELKKSKKKSKTSRRPLPKPLQGTEMLNASYTSSMLATCKPSQKAKLKSPRISPSRSMESINLKKPPKLPLSKSQKNYLLTSSLNKSWNDIMRAEQASTSKAKISKHPVDIVLATEASSSTLNGSLSSKVFKFMKGSRENLTDKEATDSSMESMKSSSRNMSVSSETDSSLEEYEVHLFTIAHGSKMFNIIEQSWIYSVIVSVNSFLKIYSGSVPVT